MTLVVLCGTATSVVFAQGLIAQGDLEDYQSSRIFKISTKLEGFKTKSGSLEIAVQAAHEKEKELIDMLNDISNDKGNLKSHQKFQVKSFYRLKCGLLEGRIRGRCFREHS